MPSWGQDPMQLPRDLTGEMDYDDAVAYCGDLVLGLESLVETRRLYGGR